MPKVKTVIPASPSREKGQRSLDDAYINRYIPQWAQPHWQTATFWRTVVATLPAATDCREYIISHISSLSWKVEPRESTQREELKDEIIFHTELFEAGGYYDISGWDYLKMVEWGLKDALDTPFGTGFETIREGDKPDGRVLKIIPIDSATLNPTLNKDWPVFQRLQSNPTRTVVFPAHAINRFYYSPRTEYLREGWGMPPPEKIFLALEMIRRGDIYYSKFLSDTPEAGILDLINMEEDAAVAWIQGFKDLFTGIEPMKIPVLYQHDTPAKWIPFGKDPNTLQFEEAYAKYVILACAGYGISPTDIGFPSKGGGGGETLGGSIRDDRRTKKTGIAKTKKIMKYWFDRMLSPGLMFTWIDLDDEVSVSLGRARLASATAASQYIENRMFTPKEMRLQAIADGLITIPVPEDVPEDEFKIIDDAKAKERPGMLGAPINPSQGGRGEVLNRGEFSDVLIGLLDISDNKIRKLAKAILPIMREEFNTVLSDKLSGKAISRIVRNEKWLAFPTQDVTKIVYELEGLFRSKDAEVSKGVIKQFKSDVRDEIRQLLSGLNISKSIIGGIRNYIIKTGLVELLDNNEILHDNIITSVREELAKYYNEKMLEFTSIINQKLNLEEDVDDG